MKYYVLSDIHGFYTEMIKALTEQGFFNDKEPHKLIVCGDMMDRGEEAVKMQEFMLDLLAKDELIFVRGNHEDLMIELASELRKYQNPDWFYYNNNHHWSNGTIYTAMQLCGITDEFKALDHPQKFADKIENTPFYKILIPSSINYFETEHYVFVHGWIPYNIAYRDDLVDVYTKHRNWRKASKTKWSNARWVNGIKLAANGITIKNKVVVCGHIKTSYGHSTYHKNGSINGDDAVCTPYYNDGIIALDACTVRSGFVNCIVIED